MENKDLRMKNISEVFGSLLTVKLNAWEDKFFEKIIKSREVELKFIWGVNVITSINIFLLWLAPSIVSVVTIAVYARGLHQDITAAKIFTALSLFRLLQSPLREFPRYIIQLYQSFTSLERLQTVFRMEEKTSQSHSPGWRGQQGQERSPLSGGGEGGNGFGDCCIEVSGCSFHWYAVASAMPSPEEGEVRVREKEKGAKVLSDIHAAGEEEKIPTFTLNLPSLSIHSGELVVVRGTVGQGKSSLCQALLGEMPMAPSSHSLSSSSSSWNSQCLVQGSISYASQLPWIQNTTLRQNILYTSPYDQEKYFRVLHACCLIEDLNSFPYGDLTFIGQKGINLSGGQKSRIALARAVYADHEIFLLDDILAALDSIVGKKVFDRVICGLLRDKLRILVTHKEEIIEHPFVHQVLSLSNGMVRVDRRKTIPASTAPSVSVTPDSRREIGMGKQRGSIMSVEYEIPSADYQVLCEIVSTARALHQYLPLPLPPSSGDLETGDTEETPRNYSYEGLASSASGADTAASTSALAMNFQSEEEKESGRVSAKVYAEYAKAAGGYHVIGILVLVQTIWQLLGIGSDVFLTQWSREDPEEQRENLTRNISIYALLAIGSGCIVLIRTLTISYYGYHAGRTLFNSMLSSLLYAPMWWIDKNPSGRSHYLPYLPPPLPSSSFFRFLVPVPSPSLSHLYPLMSPQDLESLQ
jgi:ATP-binding cassette, subfamily C (CFTR/MRP), member 1